MRSGVRAVAVVVCGLVLGACGASTGSTPTTTPTTTPAGASATVWLCRPGATPDPCIGDLATTAVPAAGARTVARPAVPADPPFDCFYVYPTVSTERTANADLAIQPAESCRSRVPGPAVLTGVPGVRPGLPPAHGGLPDTGARRRPDG